MLKKVFISLTLIVSFFFAFPVESFAFNSNAVGTVIMDNSYILSDDTVVDYNDQDCSGADSLLGNPDVFQKYCQVPVPSVPSLLSDVVPLTDKIFSPLHILLLLRRGLLTLS